MTGVELIVDDTPLTVRLSSFDSEKKYILAEFSTLKKAIQNNILSTGEYASGRTSSSIAVEDEGDTVKLTGRGFFAVLETGRKAGGVPMNFQKIIMDWVIAKGIAYSSIPYKRTPSANWSPKYSPNMRGLMAISGAIAHTIKTKGTKLHRTGGRTDVYTKEVDKTINNIAAFLGNTEALKISDLNTTLGRIIDNENI